MRKSDRDAKIAKARAARRPEGAPPASGYQPPEPAEPAAPVSETEARVAEHFIFGILGLAILNGIFSPLLFYVVLMQNFWYPVQFMPHSLSFVMMFASLITSTLTIMVAGIPAALYERFLNKGRTNEVSLWIWLATLAFLTMPAAIAAIQQLTGGGAPAAP